jgi:RNA polymerase sigma-70 factor (sigma-E family)
MKRDNDFVAFAQSCAPSLRRTAYLLCRDWHLAEDLTQTALARLYVVWARIDWSYSPEAYVRRILYREFLRHRGRRQARDVITATPPDGGTEASPDLRMTMLDALSHLPPRDRAIIVLRYWEDQSIETVAETLGVKTGVVKSQCMRSLAKLRTLLGEDRFALFS